MPKKLQWNQRPEYSGPCPKCGEKLLYGDCPPCRKKTPPKKFEPSHRDGPSLDFAHLISKKK